MSLNPGCSLRRQPGLLVVAACTELCCMLACSIWTIDLAHLLRQFHMQVQFLTQMVGANPAYADERFYMEQLQEDTVRVRHLFEVCSARCRCTSASASSDAVHGERLHCPRLLRSDSLPLPLPLPVHLHLHLCRQSVVPVSCRVWAEAQALCAADCVRSRHRRPV